MLNKVIEAVNNSPATRFQSEKNRCISIAGNFCIQRFFLGKNSTNKVNCPLHMCSSFSSHRWQSRQTETDEELIE